MCLVLLFSGDTHKDRDKLIAWTPDKLMCAPWSLYISRDYRNQRQMLLILSFINGHSFIIPFTCCIFHTFSIPTLFLLVYQKSSAAFILSVVGYYYDTPKGLHKENEFRFHQPHSQGIDFVLATSVGTARKKTQGMSLRLRCIP